MTGKGHVPEENLARYRQRAAVVAYLTRLGGMVSNIGEYADANTLWAMASKYREMANELRADLPDKPTKEAP